MFYFGFQMRSLCGPSPPFASGLFLCRFIKRLQCLLFAIRSIHFTFDFVMCGLHFSVYTTRSTSSGQNCSNRTNHTLAVFFEALLIKGGNYCITFHMSILILD